jgi:membrane fusion protein, copper/silver efflux system
MRSISFLLVVFVATLAAATAADTKYSKTLEQYETVRAGLAADELGAAKNGATKLVAAVQEEFAASKPMIEAAQKLAASESLEDARAAFGVISGELVKVVQGQPGVYLMNCSMAKDGTWVQKTSKIENPYMGKKMLACGEIVKK